MGMLRRLYKKNRLFIRNSLVILASSTILMGSILLALYVYIYPTMEEDVFLAIEDTLSMIVQDTDQDYSHALDYLQFTASLPVVKNLEADQIKQHLTNDFHMYNYLVVYNHYLDVIYADDNNDRTLGIEERTQAINKVLLTGEPKVSKMYVDEDNHYMSIIAPIFKDSLIVGAIEGNFDLHENFFNQSLLKISLRETGNAFLLNKEDIVISHGDERYIGLPLNDIVPDAERQTLIEMQDSLKTYGKWVGAFENSFGYHRIVAIENVLDEFQVGVIYNYDEVFAPMNQLKNMTIGIMAIAFFSALIFGFIYQIRISTPMKHLIDESEKIAHGDYRSIASIKQTDELQYFIKALNRVLDEKDKLFEQMVQALVLTMEKKDAYTAGHSQRVMEYALQIAEQMNVSKEDMNLLRLGAILHDVGKVGVSDQVLIKPGKLTADEFDEIKKHPVYGYDIIKHVKNLHDVLPIIRSHHERYDGKGYPDGIKGKNIHFLARITCVADAFDAMTSERAYRKAMNRDRAIQIIQQQSGAQFDPDVVDAFLKWQHCDKTHVS